MSTGKELIEVMVAVATLNTGRGFTMFTNIDSWPTERGPVNEQSLEQLAWIVIQERLQPINKIFSTLLDSCKRTGTLWKHPERGWAVKTLDQLTPEQDKLLEELQTLLKRLDTFIQNP